MTITINQEEVTMTSSDIVVDPENSESTDVNNGTDGDINNEPSDDTNTDDEVIEDKPSDEEVPMDVTTYMSLYERVLANLPEEYKLLSMSDEEITSILHYTLLPAISAFHICKADLDDRDEEKERFNIKLTTEEFIILSNYMTINYIDSNYIRVATALELSLTSKDFNTFSPAKHLDTLRSIRDMYVRENDSMCMKYSMRNKIKSLKESEDESNGRANA